MLSRNKFGSIIKNILSEYDSTTQLYGSFATDGFHYSTLLNKSFSDIDLYIKSRDDKNLSAKISREISSKIENELGMILRVSVREIRIHDNRLLPVQSYLISCFETIFKLLTNYEKAHLIYQCARFILRTRCLNHYFDKDFCMQNLVLSGISKNEAEFLYRIKTGVETCINESDFQEKVKNILSENPNILSHIKILQEPHVLLEKAKIIVNKSNFILEDHQEIVADMKDKLLQIRSTKN